MQTRLIDVKSVAERLGEKPATVYDYARQGILPCVRLGRKVKFDPKAIERWIEEGGEALPGGWRKEAA